MKYVLKQIMKAAAGLAVIATIGATALISQSGEESFACSIHGRDCQ